MTDTIKTDQDLKDAQDRLYEVLKEKVKSIKLQPGETLWIGDLQIKDIDSQKEEIIKHFTTAVSHENMSQQALIAALNAQADEAKTTKVTVNEGTKYQEELKNYYSGDENLKHKPKDPPSTGMDSLKNWRRETASPTWTWPPVPRWTSCRIRTAT